MFKTVVTLITLFAEATDDDLDLKTYIMYEDTEKWLETIKDKIKLGYRDNDKLMPSPRLIETFLKNHGDKDVWLTAVARAFEGPTKVAPKSPLQHMSESFESNTSGALTKQTDKQAQQKQSPIVDSKPHFSLARKPCSNFTGRKKTLLDIHDELQLQSNFDDFLYKVIITGMAGIGKTQTARKYASDHFSSVYSVIVFIEAQTFDSLRSSFLEAAAVSTNYNYNPNDYLTEDNVALIADIVFERLSKDYEKQKLLIIFDNAIQMESTDIGFGIRKFLPNQKYDALFHVLVTSQNQQWPSPCAVIELGTLNSADESLLLKTYFEPHLCDKLMGPEIEGALENLQKVLMGYPLGISMAACDILEGLGQDAISQDELTTIIQDYILDFEASNERMFFESSSDESGYCKMMINVLDLAISRIQKTQVKGYGLSGKSIKLLHMMSYLSPDGIDEDDCYSLFYTEKRKSFYQDNAKTKTQKKEFNACLNILKNASLIIIGESPYSDLKSVQLHRLAQKTIREKYKENISDLNFWFGLLPFVSKFPWKHAPHVVENICSTFGDNIPNFALASTYSVFSRSHDELKDRHIYFQGNDIGQINNVVLATVNIVTKQLLHWGSYIPPLLFSKICDLIIEISHSGEHAKMFWSSEPFMKAFFKQSLNFLKELGTVEEDLREILRAAATLSALTAKTTNEDFNSILSIHNDMDMEKDLLLVLHIIKRETEKGFKFLQSFLPQLAPSDCLLTTCLTNHGDKKVWFTEILRQIYFQ